MLEQVRNLVVIKISVVTIAVAFTVFKNNFHVCKNSSAPSINAALWHYLEILGMKIIVPQGY